MRDTPAWKKLESRVRTVAQFIWDCPAHSETIHGVRLDSILKLESDRWIILEVTTSNTLDKLRTDLTKLLTVRPALLSDEIHASCYFITEAEPSESIKSTASGNRIIALSVDQLEKQFIDYAAYQYVRNLKPFGSAVDPFSGEKDTLPYV